MSEYLREDCQEMTAVTNNLTADQIRNFKRYFVTYSHGINSGLCFTDDATLFLRNETKLICHIAGHLYHGHFNTALKFISIYNELYGSLTHLHASFFSISRGNAREPYFDGWLIMNFGSRDLNQYRQEYQTNFPEWIWDDEI